MKPHLNRRLRLETPVRTPDGAGGFTESWQVLGHLWAQLIAGAGQEIVFTGGVAARVPYRITMRAAPPDSDQRPKPGQRLRDGTRIFAVHAVADADEQARYLTCHASEETAP